MKAEEAANFFLVRKGTCVYTKLHSLVYLAQETSLAFAGKPLIDAPFVPMAVGPICPELLDVWSTVLIRPDENSCRSGNPSEEERIILEAVFRHYGLMEAEELLAECRDFAWKSARKRKQALESGTDENGALQQDHPEPGAEVWREVDITHEEMKQAAEKKFLRDYRMKVSYKLEELKTGKKYLIY